MDTNTKSIRQIDGELNTQSNLNPNLETESDIINMASHKS